MVGRLLGFENGKNYLDGTKVFHGIDNVSDYVDADDNWEFAKSMSSKLYLGASVQIDNTIYCIGGRNSSWAPVSGVSAYDADIDNWSTLPALPEGVYGHSAAVVNGKIYVFGGMLTGGVGAQVWTFEPGVSSDWDDTTETDMTAGRWGAACAALDNTIYLFGGEDASGNFLNSVITYDTEAQTWGTDTDMPATLKYQHAAESGGLIYVSGGHTSGNSISGAVYVLDTGTWDCACTLSKAVFGHFSVFVGGKLFVANGCNRFPKHSGWDGFFQECDLTAGTSLEHTMFFWGRYHVFGGAFDNRIYVICGFKGKVQALHSQHLTKNNAYYDLDLLAP